MTTEANFPLQQLCLKPSLYGRFSLDHLWPLLGDHQGEGDDSLPKHDLQGNLDLVVLKILAQRGKLHDYGIVLHIHSESDELPQVEEGSLYPALHCMEQIGWINSAWALTGTGRRAKYYRLTAAGRKQLNEAEASLEQPYPKPPIPLL